MRRDPTSSERDVLLPFFLALFLGAMVLGPLIYLVLHRWVPFHRAMDRALLVSALAALGLAWPRLRFRTWWPWRRSAVTDLLLGLLVAILSVQTIIGLDVAFGGLRWATLTSHARTHVIIFAIIATLLVPPAEETIFRGFLQTEFTRRIGARWGWLLAALIFALAHFVKIPDSLDHQAVHPWSGVTAIGAAFVPVLHGRFFSPHGANLLIIGLILGGVFRRTGVLWFNYGLHGGWILGLLLATGLTRSTQATFWTGSDLLSSPLTTIVLVVLGWWLWRFYRRPLPPESGTGPTAP
jgi:membrane protease YdiL (CAAX protease family)